jgi:hypothetical protein
MWRGEGGCAKDWLLENKASRLSTSHTRKTQHQLCPTMVANQRKLRKDGCPAGPLWHNGCLSSSLGAQKGHSRATSNRTSGVEKRRLC